MRAVGEAGQPVAGPRRGAQRRHHCACARTRHFTRRPPPLRPSARPTRSKAVLLPFSANYCRSPFAVRRSPTTATRRHSRLPRRSSPGYRERAAAWGCVYTHVVVVRQRSRQRGRAQAVAGPRRRVHHWQCHNTRHTTATTILFASRRNRRASEYTGLTLRRLP